MNLQQRDAGVVANQGFHPALTLWVRQTGH